MTRYNQSCGHIDSADESHDCCVALSFLGYWDQLFPECSDSVDCCGVNLVVALDREVLRELVCYGESLLHAFALGTIGCLFLVVREFLHFGRESRLSDQAPAALNLLHHGVDRNCSESFTCTDLLVLVREHGLVLQASTIHES